MRVHARRALLESGLVANVTVGVSGDRISAIEIGDDASPFDADLVAPGFVDLQYNGGFGVEIGAAADAIALVAARLPATGVTSFLPTLVSLRAEAYRDALAAFGHAQIAQGDAKPLGLHLEGPFLSVDAPGAHDAAAIAAADDALFDELVASGRVALMTIAPEREGALARIARLVAEKIVVSIGHTRATYEQALAAADAGATTVTHLFNAMTPFDHRAPGVVGAALADERITCGMIADGVHLHDVTTRFALRVKGPDRVVLVTDAMAAAGMGPGTYALAGKTVRVDDTSARLDDGTLAGSILTMDRAVKNVVALGTPLADALRMASTTPARVLGLAGKGRIAVGADADIVLLSDDLAVTGTMIAGVMRRGA